MTKPQTLTPHEEQQVEAQREEHPAQQPYASELDDRELEHAHKEKRPVRLQSEGAEQATPDRPSQPD